MPVSRDQDIAFSFDPKPFVNGVEQVSKSMASLPNVAKNVAGGMGRAMFSAMAKIELLKAGFRAVHRGLKQIASFMPEVGKTFEIARGVIMKNLLWPLRQELAPILQNLLDWVRDNRALFIRWGQAIANVFRVAISAGRQLIQLVRNLVDMLRPAIERVFGDLSGGIESMVNLVLAKVAVVVTFLIRLLTPVAAMVGDLVSKYLPGVVDWLASVWESVKGIAGSLWEFVTNLTSANEQGNSLATVVETIADWFSKVVGFIVEMTNRFLQGFVPAVENIMTPIQRIVDAFAGLTDRIFTNEEAVNSWGKAFEWIGNFLGENLIALLEVAASIVEGIVIGIEWAITGINELFGKMKEAEGSTGAGGTFMSGVGDFLKDAFGAGAITRGGVAGATWRGFTGMFKRPDHELDDGIITPRGEVVKTHPDDTIIATKTPGRAMGGSVEQNVTFNLNVTEGNARQTGFNFAEGLQAGLRSQLMDAMATGGY